MNNYFLNLYSNKIPKSKTLNDAFLLPYLYREQTP